MPRPFLAASLAMLVAGCEMVDGPVTGPPGCPVVESHDWSAFVNAMPGPRPGPELIVTGQVLLPSTGYRVELRPGPTERSLPPVQTVELIAIPPDGPAAPVLAVENVRLSMPAGPVRAGGPPPYRGVRVLCDGTELAFIAPVDVAW